MANSINGLMKNIQRDVQNSVDQHARDISRTAQMKFDAVYNAHTGEPVETIMPHMRRAFRDAGLTPDSDAELRRYAQTGLER